MPTKKQRHAVMLSNRTNAELQRFVDRYNMRASKALAFLVEQGIERCQEKGIVVPEGPTFEVVAPTISCAQWWGQQYPSVGGGANDPTNGD